jgi:hypothetical protein
MMTLIAIRINSVLGDPESDESEFDDAHEEIVYIETSDFASMENGISDIRDAITDWEKYHGVPEANEAQ